MSDAPRSTYGSADRATLAGLADSARKAVNDLLAACLKAAFEHSDRLDKLRAEAEELRTKATEWERRCVDEAMRGAEAFDRALDAEGWAVAALSRCADLERENADLGAVVEKIVRDAFDAGVRWQSDPGDTLSTRARREAEAIEAARAALRTREGGGA